MDGFLQDLRYSVRRLLSAPGFTLAVTLILGLGIGANSALFTTLDRMIIRPLPYASPNQLVMLWEDFSAFGVPKNRVSPATFMDWRKRAGNMAEVAAYGGRTFDLAESGPPEEVLGQGVTSALLPMLGITPLTGRTFSTAEDVPGAKVAILSYTLWQRRFRGDPHLVGQSILMNGEKYDVIGVMPKGFQFPDRETEIWVPLGLTPQLLARRNSHFLHVVGRIRDDRSIRQARDEMTAVASELAHEYPATNAKAGITVVPLKDEFLGETRSTLILLLCSAGCVLLIACANVGNLLLARSAARRKEVSVRLALGASASRVLRQILTENVALAAAGGILGLVFAKWTLLRLTVLIPPSLAGTVDMGLDWRAIAVTAGISIVTGLLFGLAPASRLLRKDLSNPLQDASRGNVVQAGSRLRDTLVVAEIGIALVLAIGAVLLIQTLVRLRSFDAGFQASGILTAQINAPIPKYQEPTERQTFYSRILEKVQALPGVKSAGLTSDLPYTSRGNTMSLTIEGRQQQAGLGSDALFRLVSDGYLQTIGAQLREGRFLDSRDRMDTLPVVVVNETLARKYWPNDTAIGRRIDTGTGDGDPKWMTIVGVVHDVRERGLDLESKGAVYVPFTQTTIGFFLPSEIAILTSRGPLSLSKELQQAVWSVDAEQPVSNIATMESIVDGEFGNRTQVLRLLGAFAALALVLAAFGIYGVLSYVVSVRTREIGLRIAIGASRLDIMREMFTYSSKLIGAGLTLGLLASLGATRLLSSLLFGVSALDPVTFGMAAAGLAMVGLLASWIPLVRAGRIDPMAALRLE